MRRGTTPKVTIAVTGTDLSAYNEIWITFKQDKTDVTKTLEDLTIEEDKITLELTQTDTLKFNKGPVRIQMRAIDGAGNAIASSIYSTTIEEILKEGVIE